MRSICLAIV